MEVLGAVARAFSRARRSIARRFQPGQPLETVAIGPGRLSFNPNHSLYTRTYYLYCVRLLREAMAAHGPRVHAVLGDYSVHGAGLPIFRVALQIEHTLVKPGGRDADSAPLSPVNDYLVRLDRREQLEKADAIIEYSAPNLEHVAQSGLFPSIAAKTRLIAPLLGEIGADRAETDRDLGTITLFGNPDEPRRKSFLQSLTDNGIAVQNVMGIYEEVESIYRRARILINIRQTDHHHTLEELRVLPALMGGVVVVSEDAPLRQRCGYDEHIVWGRLDELPAIVRDVEANYAAYRARIFNNRLQGALRAIDASNRASARSIAGMMSSLRG